MTLEMLLKVIPPPAQPTEVGSNEDWSRVESTLRTKLPQDYKDYISTYGSGQVGNFLTPYNPFSANRYLNLMRQIPETLDALRVMKEEIGEEEFPYSLYPEPDGLLPWGGTDNGDELLWLTTGDPDRWTVVTYQPRGSGFAQFQETMTSFIAKAVSGEIMSEVLPADYLMRHRRFDVYDPNKQQ